MDYILPSMLLASSSIAVHLHDKYPANKDDDDTFIKVGYIATIVILISSVLLILSKTEINIPISPVLFIFIILGACASSAINLHNRLRVNEKDSNVVYGQFIFSIFCLVMSLYYIIQYSIPNFDINNPIILCILTMVVNAFSIHLFNRDTNDNAKERNSPINITMWVLIVVSIIFTGIEFNNSGL